MHVVGYIKYTVEVFVRVASLWILIWTLGRPLEQESGKSGAHSVVSFGRNTGLYTRVYVFHDPHLAWG